MFECFIDVDFAAIHHFYAFFLIPYDLTTFDDTFPYLVGDTLFYKAILPRQFSQVLRNGFKTFSFVKISLQFSFPLFNVSLILLLYLPSFQAMLCFRSLVVRLLCFYILPLLFVLICDCTMQCASIILVTSYNSFNVLIDRI